MPPPPPPPPDSRASTPTQVGDDEGGKEELSSERGAVAEGPESQVAQRSRWQAVLLEAGGLSAALSEESMRRLKYCLHWLQVCRLFSSLFLMNISPIYLSASVRNSSHRRPNPNSTRLHCKLTTSPLLGRIHISASAHLGRTHAQTHGCAKGYRAYDPASRGCGVQVCWRGVAGAGEGEGEGVYFEVATAVG